MVLHRNRFYVESPHEKILKRLLRDDVIKSARADDSGEFMVRKALKEQVGVPERELQGVGCVSAPETQSLAPLYNEHKA
jgi:hypothetical protein